MTWEELYKLDNVKGALTEEQEVTWRVAKFIEINPLAFTLLDDDTSDKIVKSIDLATERDIKCTSQFCEILEEVFGIDGIQDLNEKFDALVAKKEALEGDK